MQKTIIFIDEDTITEEEMDIEMEKEMAKEMAKEEGTSGEDR